MIESKDIKYYPNRIIGLFIETYIPAAGRIQSSLIKDSIGNGVFLKQVRFMVTTNGNITVKDLYGDAAVTIAVTASIEYSFPVSVISALTGGGNIIIFHDGEVANEQQ